MPGNGEAVGASWEETRALPGNARRLCELRPDQRRCFRTSDSRQDLNNHKRQPNRIVGGVGHVRPGHMKEPHLTSERDGGAG